MHLFCLLRLQILPPLYSTQCFRTRRRVHPLCPRQVFTLFEHHWNCQLICIAHRFARTFSLEQTIIGIRTGVPSVSDKQNFNWVGLMPAWTNNIDRPPKHSLPLTKLTNLSSESKVGWFCGLKKIWTVNELFLLLYIVLKKKFLKFVYEVCIIK